MKVVCGSVVKATAGRDKDKHFVVMSVENSDYCRIADGKRRRVASQKLKKIKHLRIEGFCIEPIAQRLKSGQTVSNSMIRKELKNFNDC